LAKVLHRSLGNELLHPGGFLGREVEAEAEKEKEKRQEGSGCLLHSLSLRERVGVLQKKIIVYPNSFGTIQRESIDPEGGMK
jgi:hypothetical protein